MTKDIFYTILIGMTLTLTSCSKFKEREMKNMLGADKPVSVDEAVAAAEKNPNFETLTAAGLALSQAKQTDRAIAYFERSLATSPKNAVAHNNLCAENNVLGKWGVSIGHCEKALAIAPDFQLAKNNLKLAQDSKAVQLKLIQDLKVKTDSAKGKDRQTHLVDLGFEYYKMGHYDDAISTWKKVQKSNDPLYVRTLNNLGSAYIILKKFDLAKSSLEEAAKLEPQNQLVKNNMAWFLNESTKK